MRTLELFVILFLVVACDPYGFGFKKNPAYVLKEALNAVENLDEEKYLNISSKEALCIYGNPEGLAYLKDNLELELSNIEIKPKQTSTSYLKNPIFVNYWSYYLENYAIDILDKSNNDLLLQVMVDCHYGADGSKSDVWVDLKPKKYPMKACQLVKIVFVKSKGLPLPKVCNLLKVNFGKGIY